MGPCSVLELVISISLIVLKYLLRSSMIHYAKSDSKTLEINTVDAYPGDKGGYKGQFILPLTYDVNVTNELTSRMKSVGPNNEPIKYDEFTFIDRANNRYKARDLWLTSQTTHNHFVSEVDGTKVVGAHIFYFTCNDFSQI